MKKGHIQGGDCFPQLEILSIMENDDDSETFDSLVVYSPD
jgi:hypothetical protein